MSGREGSRASPREAGYPGADNSQSAEHSPRTPHRSKGRRSERRGSAPPGLEERGRRRHRRPESSGGTPHGLHHHSSVRVDGGSGDDGGGFHSSGGIHDVDPDPEQTRMLRRGRGAGDDAAQVEAEYVEYEEEETPTWAYVLCVVAFPVLLCFSFMFLFIKRSKVKRRDADGDVVVPEKGGESPPLPAPRGPHQADAAGGQPGHRPPLSPLSPLGPLESRRDSIGSMSSEPTTPMERMGHDPSRHAHHHHNHRNGHNHHSGHGRHNAKLPPITESGSSTMLVTVEPSGSPRILGAKGGPIVETRRNDVVRLGHRIVLESVPPAIEGSLRAPTNGSRSDTCNIKFANRRRQGIVISRLDENGRRERIGVVSALAGVEMETPHRQPFVVTLTTSEEAISIFVAATEDCVALVD